MNIEADSTNTVPFDFQPRTRVIFGNNSVERVGELVREFGVRRVLLVTDAGIVAAGHAARVQLLLEREGLSVACFDQVEENPRTSCVEKCLEVAKRANVELIVGLGGGSSMDTAKGCNFVFTNGGQIQDYWGLGKAKLPMLPLVAIPTTGGTGSECQSFALITNEETHQKMACGDPKAAARIAILDPCLTVSQPPRVTACTGIDAIAHALETAVSNRRTPLSLLFSTQAFRLAMNGLPRVLESPADLEARGWMLLGAAWAGTAIENSMLGAAHSAANPLTAHFGIAHGQAVGMMLPHVVRFNSQDPLAAQTYSDLARAVQLAEANGDPIAAAELLAKRLESLLTSSGLRSTLKDYGVTSADVPRLAQEATTQWTAQFNPRSLTVDDFRTLYCEAVGAGVW